MPKAFSFLGVPLKGRAIRFYSSASYLSLWGNRYYPSRSIRY